MITRTFLNPVTHSRRIASSQNVQVSRMFKVFATKLTARAVQDMFEALDRAWCNYHVQSNMDGSVTLVSEAGDEFIVLPDFTCSCDGRQCWQQEHCGILCNHALNACVHRLKQERRPEERAKIIATAVERCDKNWHRETYVSVVPPSEFPKPVSLVFMPSARKSVCNRDCGELELIRRFREVLQFVSTQRVEEHLHALESDALSDVEYDDMSSAHSGHVDNMSDFSGMESSSVHSASTARVSNPRRRGPKRRRRYVDDLEDS